MRSLSTRDRTGSAEDSTLSALNSSGSDTLETLVAAKPVRVFLPLRASKELLRLPVKLNV